MEIVFKPMCDRRELARDVRGSVFVCGHFLSGEAPENAPRDLRRFLSHV